MKTFTAFFVVYSLFYIGVHLLTVHLWPLAWYDEIAVSSTALDYFNHGTYFAGVTRTLDKGFESPYGPVFFFWALPWYYFFGFGAWSHRAAVFSNGLMVLLVLAALLRQSGLSRKQCYWVVVAMSADWMFVKALREGRMDFFASFFVLFSIYTAIQFSISKKQFWICVSGFAIALSFLSSARIIIFIFVWLYLALFLVRKPYFLFIWMASGFIPILIWVLYYYGTLPVYFNHVQATMLGHSRLQGWTINFSKHQILSVFLFIYSMFYLYANSMLKSQSVIIAFLAITGFYLLIYDFGYYGVFLTPFYYWVAGLAFGDWANKTNFAQ